MNVKLKKFNILEPNVKIKAKITTEIPDPVQELSGTPPLTFKTISNELLDWTITAVTDGVGKVGKNYLKSKTVAIPNGCVGTFLSEVQAWTDVLTGFTINSGDADKIYGSLRLSNNGNLSKANVGQLMIVEGDTIPSTYDANTDLYKQGILQGGAVFNQNVINNQWQSIQPGESQIIYAGDDEYGGYHEYGNGGTLVINGRCKTYSFPVKKNTNYSIRLFNSSYNNIQMTVSLLATSGTITPQFTSLGNQKSIPDNETFVANTEQWVNLTSSDMQSRTNKRTIPVDVRPIRYEFCESFAAVKAGTYKLMVDIWGNNDLGSGRIGFQDYTGCWEDNWDNETARGNEWFALVDEENNVIVSKQDIFASGTSRSSNTAPYPNYYHREFEFTLSSDKKVGLIHKAYYTSVTYAYPANFRFYIVDSDVEAEEFTTTDVSPANISGYSAWEKYNVSLPIIVYKGDYSQAQRTVIDLGESYLESGDTLTMSDTGVTVATFEGENIINVDSEVQPNIYIKYRRF